MTGENQVLSNEEKQTEWVRKYITQGHTVMHQAYKVIPPEGTVITLAWLITDPETGDITLYVAGDKDEFLSRIKYRQVPPLTLPYALGN
ncbi:hypothetical protein G6C41_000775 [Salmonella enterica]|nr:hypothetical protein DOE63_23940 [Salmonella enterica subsp. diarizonae serovar 59:z10:-]EDR2105058.1 hypothetical protein [Salmonella enterica subsp. enterica]EEL2518131.1 hypothetical protein [Salmonella enterica]EEY6051660.1 hypothetical protein [Salmonella enterica subsp. enterica serovar Bareilly]EEO7834140.1 hypothetical protein [Salmonella enterica]